MIRARPPLALALALALTLSLAGCAHGPAARKPDAQLLVSCPVDDARVYLDETFVGRAVELRARPLRVVHGTLRLEVRADGWFTAYRDVPVAPGAAARVDVPLHRVPEGEPGG
jgi:hypothetical protein